MRMQCCKETNALFDTVFHISGAMIDFLWIEDTLWYAPELSLGSGARVWCVGFTGIRAALISPRLLALFWLCESFSCTFDCSWCGLYRSNQVVSCQGAMSTKTIGAVEDLWTWYLDAPSPGTLCRRACFRVKASLYSIMEWGRNRGGLAAIGPWPEWIARDWSSSARENRREMLLWVNRNLIAVNLLINSTRLWLLANQNGNRCFSIHSYLFDAKYRLCWLLTRWLGGGSLDNLDQGYIYYDVDGSVHYMGAGCESRTV